MFLYAEFEYRCNFVIKLLTSLFASRLEFLKYTVMTAPKQHIIPRNIFSTVYSFSIMLFFENSFRKASGLLFIFIHVSTCHAHFCRDKIQVSWGPERPTPVFVSSRMPEKLDLKSMAYIDCFYNLMICSRGCRKTYTHTYMHTQFF